MTRLYSARFIIKILSKSGFKIISQKGSHIKLQKSSTIKTLTVIVSFHKEVAMGTFGSILRQAEMTKSEFEKLK